jgi:hypothetical protein
LVSNLVLILRRQLGIKRTAEEIREQTRLRVSPFRERQRTIRRRRSQMAAQRFVLPRF